MPMDAFGALANPVRRQILIALRDDPLPAGELAALFDLSRPAVSEHLQVLRDARLVSERRDGRRRIYRLEAEPLAEIDEWLHPFEKYWRGRLTALAAVLDDLEPDPQETP
ncbi:ArsR family transcriptional regulator [Microbacterium mangrovi]|uniref:ArsR family transcriptional regulator n=1 Tax=Microbacterium mangrovi TaxID=1348253 RepID=A0A0B2A3C6_9MICO|nr:metalloregulator ArsR/SmtB family transcription factor [Microbacterium mangrovi]KHK96083.1 ArsR family transcriptional regulator [Microbacterium mangrovi]